MRALRNVWRLGIKELFSLARDPVLMGLIIYTFTAAIYTVANGVQTELRNAAIAVADEDRSILSSRISEAFLRPYFQPARLIGYDEVDELMDAGEITFALVIPPGFEKDVLEGRQPELQLNVDATAMTMAGTGAVYIQRIVLAETARYVSRASSESESLATLKVRARSNPNLEASWFLATMQVVNNLTILTIILAGAAVIREREHGTIEHLMTLPLRSWEVMMAKIWANGFVVLLAAILSLELVVRGVLDVPLAGSVALFAAGSSIYLFATAALGIMLSTLATTMPQFGLLAIPVFVVMNLLSGGVTPMESMPDALQTVMQASPSTHFTAFAKSVLLRGAGLEQVWAQLAAMAAIGTAFFIFALARFRGTMAAAR